MSFRNTTHLICGRGHLVDRTLSRLFPCAFPHGVLLSVWMKVDHPNDVPILYTVLMVTVAIDVKVTVMNVIIFQLLPRVWPSNLMNSCLCRGGWNEICQDEAIRTALKIRPAFWMFPVFLILDGGIFMTNLGMSQCLVSWLYLKIRPRQCKLIARFNQRGTFSL